MQNLKVVVLSIFIFGTNAFADPESVESPSPSRFGLYGSLLGDPGINLLGLNLAYRASDDLHLNFGVGSMFGLGNSIGGSAHYLIPMNSRFRPLLGAGLTTLIVNDWDSSETTSLDFPGFTIVYPTLKLGVQYEAPSGFFMALHFSTYFFFHSNRDHTVVFPPVPALAIGSYF